VLLPVARRQRRGPRGSRRCAVAPSLPPSRRHCLRPTRTAAALASTAAAAPATAAAVAVPVAPGLLWLTSFTCGASWRVRAPLPHQAQPQARTLVATLNSNSNSRRYSSNSYNGSSCSGNNSCSAVASRAPLLRLMPQCLPAQTLQWPAAARVQVRVQVWMRREALATVAALLPVPARLQVQEVRGRRELAVRRALQGLQVALQLPVCASPLTAPPPLATPPAPLPSGPATLAPPAAAAAAPAAA